MSGGAHRKHRNPQEEFDDERGIYLDGQNTNYHEIDDDDLGGDEVVGEDRDHGPDHYIRSIRKKSREESNASD